MMQLLYRNRFFLFPQLLFLLISAVYLLLYSKPELHILINQHHSDRFDAFFKFITNLGSGFLYIAGIIFLINKKFKWFLVYTVAIAISNVTLIIFKQYILEISYRPAWYFYVYENYRLHLVDGIIQHHLNSFPSGHTTTAFTVFLLIAISCRLNISKLFAFTVAILIAFSRVYLSQHFLGDIVAGSILGTGSIFLAYFIMSKFDKPWMQLKLFQIFFSKERKKAILTQKA